MSLRWQLPSLPDDIAACMEMRLSSSLVIIHQSGVSPPGQVAEQQSALHGYLHPVYGRHVRLARGPQLLLRAPEVLGEHEEVEAEGGALEAGVVQGVGVGGHHPPVHWPGVESPAEPGSREADGGGAVDADLVPGQVDCLLESWRRIILFMHPE